MVYIYTTFIYKPLFNLLIFLYQHAAFMDLGIAIILLTLIVRIVLFPFFYKGARDQAILQKIAPKIKEIQTRLKEDKQKQMEEIMAIYKEHKVNPFSAFLILLLVQLPIMFALFRLFVQGIHDVPRDMLYSFVSYPGALRFELLNVLDLSKPNVLMVLVVALLQYLQSWMMLPASTKNKAFKDLETTEMMAKQMMIMGPILTFVIFFRMPSAVVLYWLVTTLFSVGQQVIINKRINIVKDHGKLTVAE